MKHPEDMTREELLDFLSVANDAILDLKAVYVAWATCIAKGDKEGQVFYMVMLGERLGVTDSDIEKGLKAYDRIVAG